MPSDVLAATPIFASAKDERTDLLVIPLFEEEAAKLAGPAAGIDDASHGALSAVIKGDHWRGKLASTLLCHLLGKPLSARVLLIGLGKRREFSVSSLRRIGGVAVKQGDKLQAATLTIAAPDLDDLAGAARALAEGAALGAYRFTAYKTQDAKKTHVTRLRILLPSAQRKGEPAIKAALERAAMVARQVSLARDLVNEPPSDLPPEALAEAARQAAKRSGLQITVYDKKQIEKMKMGCLLGVARGSDHEPRFIHLQYTPKNAAKAKNGAGKKTPPSRHLALIGKGITFDSGGLSLKTPEGMKNMNYDMAGGAAVIAAMEAVALLEPPFPVMGLVPASENMTGGNAYKLNDVLRSMHGKTVEVNNTDAEGRLILADALHYANTRGATEIIDLATLTGACMVALGHYTAGVFSNKQSLAQSVLAAAERAGESMWQLPMIEEIKEGLKSDVADLSNVGGRYGGAIAAAIFLREFVGETPWVHLDIAGPAMGEKDRDYIPKGGTGFAVATLIEYVDGLR